MRIVLLGGTGHIGTYLVPRLVTITYQRRVWQGYAHLCASASNRPTRDIRPVGNQSALSRLVSAS